MPPVVIAAAIAAGATATGSVINSRSQRRASNVTDRANRASEDDARAQREEDRRRWEAEQLQAAQDRAAQEEERAYRRQQDEYARQKDEYQQQLLREREARAAPYRQASQAALGNLGQLLGIDMAGSPLAQSLSAPRTLAGPGGPPTSGPMPLQRGPWGSPGPLDRNGGINGGSPQQPDVMTARDPMTARRRLPMTLGDMTGLQARY